MIAITPAAKQKFLEITAAEGREGHGLRVTVKNGGTYEPEFALNFVGPDDVQADDTIIDLGEIRLTGDPRTVSGTLERRLWQKAVAKRELETIAAANRVVSTRLQAGEITIHVEADAPPAEGFEPATPDLEDVYLSTVGAGRGA